MFVHRDGSGRIVDVTGSVNVAELEKLMAEQDQAEKQAKKEAAAEAKKESAAEAKKEAASEAREEAKKEAEAEQPKEKVLPTKHAGSDKPTEKAAGVSPPAKRTGGSR